MNLKSIAVFILSIFFMTTLSGCGYNSLQRRDEQVKMAWSQLMTVYQKRHDLIPSLVSVVQGYAKHEKDVLTAVTEARASVGQPKTFTDATEAEAETFLNKQKAVAASMSRLLLVAENYPQLKADANFQQLQRELVNVENQIVAAKNRYTREISDYNTVVRSFPTNITASVFGHNVKAQLAVDDEASIKKNPQIKF